MNSVRHKETLPFDLSLEEAPPEIAPEETETWDEDFEGQIPEDQDGLEGKKAREIFMAETKNALARLEESVRKNQSLTPLKREQELSEIQKLLQDAGQTTADLSYEFEDNLQILQEKIKSEEVFNQKIRKEAQRSAGIGEALAHELDQAFGAPTSPSGSPWHSFVTGKDERLGGAILFTFGLGATLIGLAGGNLLDETEGPSSDLKKLPQTGQALDLIMLKNSGMARSPAAGQIVRILYNTKFGPEEQVAEMKKALSGLPAASQAYVLTMVTGGLAQGDPQKLKFLSEASPQALEFMKHAITLGQNDIQGGQMVLGEGPGYKVSFQQGEYKIENTDTSWFRNDWNPFGLKPTDIVLPMGSALREIDNSLQGLDSAEPTEPAPPELSPSPPPT